jgi:hypothetical protein
VNSFTGHLAVWVHKKEGLVRQTYLASFRYRIRSSKKWIDVEGTKKHLEGDPILNAFIQGILKILH